MTDTPSLRDGLLASGETLSSHDRPRPGPRRREASGARATLGAVRPVRVAARAHGRPHRLFGTLRGHGRIGRGRIAVSPAPATAGGRARMAPFTQETQA